MLFRLAALTMLLAIAGSAGPAAAQTEIIDSAFNTCTTLNCRATGISGWVGSLKGKVVPWTAKFLAVAGNCLRLDVRRVGVAGTDLEMTVIAPDALTRYRNDQGGQACTNCPVVKISPVPKTGYYTVILSSADGAAIDSTFGLIFGQYNGGNPNCATPTVALPR